MMKFSVGVIFGIILATIGFSGLASLGDKGVQKVQEVAKEASK
jgi:hypothetical protein